MVTPADVQQGGTGGGGGGARARQQQGDDHGGGAEGGGGGDLKVSELHEKHWSTLSLNLGDDGVLVQPGGGGGDVHSDVQDLPAAQALMVTPADIQQGGT